MSPSAETASLGRIQAVLFDMDGLLVDSERIYSDVVNEVLAPYGKKQTWDIKARLMGKPERVATSTLDSHASGATLELVAAKHGRYWRY